ncbi:hypothetical protein CDAR_497421 [Caerostris darwini]|uniref:Uncharacterized protein n=1 Tax=Caerostris darwini TaxID=1538125 RepID=A0AAV4S6D7_9ARAC|nr:hypothetical protein CDAR_497421 [Caerostris darwini]
MTPNHPESSRPSLMNKISFRCLFFRAADNPGRRIPLRMWVKKAEAVPDVMGADRQQIDPKQFVSPAQEIITHGDISRERGGKNRRCLFGFSFFSSSCCCWK